MTDDLPFRPSGEGTAPLVIGEDAPEENPPAKCFYDTVAKVELETSRLGVWLDPPEDAEDSFTVPFTPTREVEVRLSSGTAQATLWMLRDTYDGQEGFFAAETLPLEDHEVAFEVEDEGTYVVKLLIDEEQI